MKDPISLEAVDFLQVVVADPKIKKINPINTSFWSKKINLKVYKKSSIKEENPFIDDRRFYQQKNVLWHFVNTW